MQQDPSGHQKSSSAASVKSAGYQSANGHSYSHSHKGSAKISADYARNRHSVNDLRGSSTSLSSKHSYESHMTHLSAGDRTQLGSLSDQLEVHTLTDSSGSTLHNPHSSGSGTTSATRSQRSSMGHPFEHSTAATSQVSSRKSSGNSINSLSFDKMILSWDPTDPDEWNMQRIASWLKYHEFPETWIQTFKKYRLVGHNFIKLLAYENFAVYEKYLPQSKNATYTRFQHLLKQTMSKNVTNNNHGNGRSNRSSEVLKSSRSSSESLKSKTHNDEIDTQTSRSASESVITPVKSVPLRNDDKPKQPQLRTHQKTKSASVLYRKSFISLRGSLTPSSGLSNKEIHSQQTTAPPPPQQQQQQQQQRPHLTVTNPTSNKNTSGIKLKIPSRPSSIIESTASSSKSSTPPLSPASYSNIFRRNHKSSSSESSLLNAIFGNSHNNNSNATLTSSKGAPTATTPNQNKTHSNIPQKPHHVESPSSTVKRKSLDATLKLKTAPQEQASASPIKSAGSEEKSNLWEKIKRRSQFSSPYSTSPLPTPVAPSRSSSITTLTPGKIDDVQSPSTASVKSVKTASNLSMKSTPNVVASPTPPPKPPKPPQKKSLEIDAKFFPTENREIENVPYLLITKDKKSYMPVFINSGMSVESFKETLYTKMNVNPKQSCVHMTNFKGELGSPLTDEAITELLKFSFIGSTLLFYIKDNSKIPNRMRASTLSSEVHNQLRSVKSKSSVRSITSSLHGTADDVSIITSSSDITSSEDHSPGNAFRRYPQTPSYYYDGAVLNNSGSEETNYWNVKERVPDEVVVPTMSSKPAQKFNLHLPDKKRPDSSHNENENKGTFNILRKDESGEIDFNNRRESPYMNAELAPKRNAPKPPSNISPPRHPSLTTHASVKPRLRRTSTKRKVKAGIRPVPGLLSKSPVETGSPTSPSIVTSYTPASTQVLVPQPYKGASEVTRKKKGGEDHGAHGISYINRQTVNRSNSIVSNNNSVFSSPSPLLKRASSRRVVSSASAADVFIENDITFADAPPLSESDSDGESNSYDSDSSGDIIWANASDSRRKPYSEAVNASADDDTTFATTPTTGKDSLMRKMTLRPSPEAVYQNLEKFFPKANLDKPVVEGGMSPVSPISMRNAFQPTPAPPVPTTNPFSETSDNANDQVISSSGMSRLKTPKRAKTIRTIAHEASEKRKKSIKIKRQNTKMWGTKVIEITDKQAVSINKAKNSKGEYKEFAWIKGEMIGKGSFGAVYLSLNVTTGEMMAVKQVEVPKYSAQDENVMNMVEALESEMATLKDLDHPNIVQYLGFEIKENIYSLFIEYVAGGSVGSLIRMYGRFDEPLIQYLTFQVLEGLSYLHSKGILHRDMKADNVLLDQDGVCKISDFGISKKSKDIYSNSDMTMRGTVFWMAPEMVDTKQGYSAKVDIWALGCVVLEMFAGKRPWSNLEVVAAMFKIGKAKSAPPIPDDTLPLISDNGRQLLDACFKIDPEERPTADQLLTHPFLKTSKKFVFRSTKLWKFIKSNDKINSTKLRVSSQDSNK